jgi:hypothetical protein
MAGTASCVRDRAERRCVAFLRSAATRYRRTVIFYVMSAKKEETRLRREPAD